MSAVLAEDRWPLAAEQGTLRFFRPVLPEWVLPVGREVSDCYWLAYRGHVERLAGEFGAVVATLAWVAGGGQGPMTGRLVQPVTPEQAEIEWWSTFERDRLQVPAPVRERCGELGVPYLPVLPGLHVTPDWAGQVWRTLKWLTFRGPTGRGVDPPIALPARNPDGGLATADQLYAVAIERAPWDYEVMEQKAELRDRVTRRVLQSRQLDRIVRGTKRAAGVAAA
jgi:hypothetical protein